MADSKISDLADGTTPATTDSFVVSRSGGTTVRLTWTEVKAAIQALASDTFAALTDITTNNASTSAHGFLKKLSGTATQYMGGDGNWTTPPVTTDATLTATDITTNNSSTSQHGFLKKLDNTATHYMDGTGAWSTPPGGGVNMFPFTTGLYYSVPQINAGGATAQHSMTQNTGFFIPFVVTATTTFVSIGLGIWTGVGSSSVRVGIYNDNGTGKPGTLVLDAGAITTTGSGTVECGAFSQALTAGLYWLCAASQGAAAQIRGINYLWPVAGDTLGNAVGSGATVYGYTAASYSGALPTPAGTVSARTTQQGPLLAIKVA